MTRKEAIKICKNIDASAEIRFKHPEVEEAFNMAIEALEQLTSYEQTINKLTKAISEQEPKTGQWKVVSDGYGDSAYICECSECKDTVWVYKDADRK